MNTQQQVKPYKSAHLSECTELTSDYTPFLHGKLEAIFFSSVSTFYALSFYK